MATRVDSQSATDRLLRDSPELSVVVASHFRPLRLRWLLNALSEQTLERHRWEVVVCHDSGPETARVLAEHRLAAEGVLRHTSRPAGTGTRAGNHNRALALARAPTVVFTHDDCRPPPEWLDRVYAAVLRHPGAIVQGPVVADPAEAPMLSSSYPRTQQFSAVPRVWGDASNIAYPRTLLEQLGGFEEAGGSIAEDTDLLLRALRSGAACVGDNEMGTRHCIEEGTLLDGIRAAAGRRGLPSLVGRRPELREYLFAGLFSDERHAWLLLGLLGLGLGRRRPPALALTLPWAIAHRRRAERPVRRGGWRSGVRTLAEVPGWVLIDAAGVAVLVNASLREGVAVL